MMQGADPLSEMLSQLSTTSLLSATLRATGDWSLRFPSVGVKFNVIMEGTCFLIPSGSEAPTRLEAGDCLILTNCGSYVLCSDPLVPPVEAATVFSTCADASLGPDGGRGRLFAVGGRITLDEASAGLLLDALPPVFRIGSASREAPAIRWLLSRLSSEWTAARPGSTLAANHLSQLLFVEAIRAWLHSVEGPGAGWLHAISDRSVGAAIRLLHTDPSRPWRLQELAKVAGMSRSGFALRFKQMAGLSPLDYLLRWRMRLGAKALRAGAEPIGAISLSLGYQSESAFSNAFKRVTGMAPQEYRRSHRHPQPGRSS